MGCLALHVGKGEKETLRPLHQARGARKTLWPPGRRARCCRPLAVRILGAAGAARTILFPGVSDRGLVLGYPWNDPEPP